MATTDEVIKEELGKIGARGKLGDDEVTLGGLGAQLAADGMPNNVYTVAIDVPASAEVASAAVARGVAVVGSIIGHDPSNPRAALRAVIRAGFWNLNPALVEVEVSDKGDGQSRITLTGTAKEGWIKQRSGEKAVLRLIAAVPMLTDSSTRTPPRPDKP